MEAYLALFGSAFLAATFLVLPIEAVVLGMMAAGGYDAGAIWLIASLGNTLGAVVNWALGRFCIQWRDRKWFPVAPAQLERASGWFGRWGKWSLLLAWLPIVGDPLTAAAGLLRIGFLTFVALVGIGKVARFAAVVFAGDKLFG